MTTILLVEDDASLGQTLTERLEAEGYAVRWAKTLQTARQALTEAGQTDLAIIDIGLPDGSGLELARDLRNSFGLPVVFLTAMNSAEFRLEGFEIGAEDFIPKPFHLKELLLRVSRVLERNARISLYRFRGFDVDFEARAVIFPGGEREFPQVRDFELLRYLIENAPRAVSREEILQSAWKNDASQGLRSVDNSVVRLRQVFQRGRCETIRSVRGVGYQWVALK